MSKSFKFTHQLSQCFAVKLIILAQKAYMAHKTQFLNCTLGFKISHLNRLSIGPGKQTHNLTALEKRIKCFLL